ncbi:MAG: hypothetical protein JWO67_1119 [Streptosporangiaceae bacterium]|nr:hypothetical protein [Streptosporangiaceae bacterium]
MRGTLAERLYARLELDEPTGCRLWTGCTNSKGYGVISVNGERKLVHRVAWELERGPIPDGLTIDHVYDRGCRHKLCAWVEHLEPVTGGENTRRSLPYRPARSPRRPKPEPALDEGYWLRFREWAGPEEWADLTPADRAIALAAAP